MRLLLSLSLLVVGAAAFAQASPPSVVINAQDQMLVDRAGYSSGRHEQREHEASEPYSRDAREHIKRECGVGTSAEKAKCVREIVEAEREAKRNESDLAAQWKAADWVFWAGVIGGAQLLISGFGLVALLETIKQGRNANEISREIGQAQVRAYITVEGVGFHGGAPGSVYCAYRVGIRNTGQSPARKITIEVEIEPSIDVLRSLGEKTKRTSKCADLAASTSHAALPEAFNLRDIYG
ncbi:MAG: hypothetical protein H2054_12620 [Sphingomonas sp.]|uniref:hypothetical protein n=1 Tax=Sphingomonas sp. TaxID=28214 RepID=UPI001836F55B|nr:hypothetical protein [Sphingomonas sp.]